MNWRFTLMQGVVLKPRFGRGGHIFEVPIMLTQSAKDYRVVAAAYIVPPLLTIFAKYYVIKPLRKRSRVRKVGQTEALGASSQAKLRPLTYLLIFMKQPCFYNLNELLLFTLKTS